MKIATWNVNSIRARQDRLLAWLDTRTPDLVCLQETKVIDDEFPHQELAELGYASASYGQKSYNGVALLSRYRDFDGVICGFDDGQPEDEERRVISALVDGVRLVSVYVPNGKSVGTDSYQYKLDWFERLRRYFDRIADPSQPVALLGDFNVAPTDLDVYDAQRLSGSILCSEPERIRLRQVIDWGFEDAYRRLHDDSGFSWWDYRNMGFKKNRGLRIDHVYLSKPLADRCTEVVVDREERAGKQPSDHAPVIATIAEGNGR